MKLVEGAFKCSRVPDIRICFVGHITRDRIRIGNREERIQPGGTAWYGAIVAAGLGADVCIVTSFSATDRDLLTRDLHTSGAAIHVDLSPHSTTFVNRYDDVTLESRSQWIEAVAEPLDRLPVDLDADVTVFGPLTPLDFPPELMSEASSESIVALDIQGLLRSPSVGPVSSSLSVRLHEYLLEADVVKASLEEACAATSTPTAKEAADVFLSYGISEILITLGSRGSLVTTKWDCIELPAFGAGEIVDTTGCGDVYLASYIVKRMGGQSVRDAAEAASAAAALSATTLGVPRITDNDIKSVIRTGRVVEPGP